MLGLVEPRYIHWAHLRLYLVHVKGHHQNNISNNNQSGQLDCSGGESKEDEAIVKGPKRRRLNLAVSSASLEALSLMNSPPEEASNSATPGYVILLYSLLLNFLLFTRVEDTVNKNVSLDSLTDLLPPSKRLQSKDASSEARTDYFFIPQPWISEKGTVKAAFFTHLLLSICSMILRFSGSPLDVLAAQYHHILSPVSFRLLCHVSLAPLVF